MSSALVGVAVAPRQIWVSGTNLFIVAAQYLNDATQWYPIAQLNGLTDPWIGTATLIKLPSVQAGGNGGILGA